MTHDDFPFGFLSALSRDKEAMRSFSGLTREEKSRLCARANAAETSEDVTTLVASLSHTIDAREYH